MHAYTYIYIRICMCVLCVFPISVSRCWSLGHVQMFYSKAYVPLPLVETADGRGGATPGLSASHAMMSCVPFDRHLHLLPRKQAQEHHSTSYLSKLLFLQRISQKRGRRSPFLPCTAFMFSVLALLRAFVRDDVEEGDYIPATATITSPPPSTRPQRLSDGQTK